MRPDQFDADPRRNTSNMEWKHWYKTFSNYLESIAEHRPNKLKVLVKFLSPQVYDYISECTTYEAAVNTLFALYAKHHSNEAADLHANIVRKPGGDETFDEFTGALENPSIHCSFETVGPRRREEESGCDLTVSRLPSRPARQSSLESRTLEMSAALQQRCDLDVTRQNLQTSRVSASATAASPHVTVATRISCLQGDDQSPEKTRDKASSARQKGFFCGNKWHPRSVWPARNKVCMNCGKNGHYQIVCRSPVTPTPTPTPSSLDSVSHATVTFSSQERPSKAAASALFSGNTLHAQLVIGISVSARFGTW